MSAVIQALFTAQLLMLARTSSSAYLTVFGMFQKLNCFLFDE